MTKRQDAYEQARDICSFAPKIFQNTSFIRDASLCNAIWGMEMLVFNSLLSVCSYIRVHANLLLCILCAILSFEPASY